MHRQDYLLNGRLVNNMVKMLFTRCKVHILYDIIQGTIVSRRSLQRSFSSIKSSRRFGFDSTTLNTKTTRSNGTRRSIRYSPSLVQPFPLVRRDQVSVRASASQQREREEGGHLPAHFAPRDRSVSSPQRAEQDQKHAARHAHRLQ